MEHDWVPSTLGHGETMCTRCSATNREAAAVGWTTCPGRGVSEVDEDDDGDIAVPGAAPPVDEEDE